MPKIIFNAVLRRSTDTNDQKQEPIFLAATSDLTGFNFFVRRTVGELLRFAARTVVKRTALGSSTTVKWTETQNSTQTPFLIHVMIRADGLAAIAMAQEDYPLRVIFGLLHKTLTDFDVRHPTWKSDEHDMDQEGKDEKMSDLMKQDLIQFQDPLKVDKLLQAQKSLEDVKTILTKNIDEILNREEKLTSLMAKSKDLSEYSKGFQTKAKKMNQCCKAY